MKYSPALVLLMYLFRLSFTYNPISLLSKAFLITLVGEAERTRIGPSSLLTPREVERSKGVDFKRRLIFAFEHDVLQLWQWFDLKIYSPWVTFV
jgi:hypothetical protein